MTRPETISTDSPQPSANPLLASWQLVFWLFFRPSVWNNHLARLDKRLHPYVALAELTWRQWRTPAILWSLLLPGAIWTAIVGGLSLYDIHLDSQTVAHANMITNILVIFCISFAISIAAGMTIGATFSMAGVLMVALGKTFSLTVDMSREALTYGIAMGVVVSTAGNVARNLSNIHLTPSVKQFASVGKAILVIPVIILAFLVATGRPPFHTLAATLVAIAVPFPIPILHHTITVSVFEIVSSLIPSSFLSLACLLTIGWRTRRWRKAVGYSLVLLVVVTLISQVLWQSPNLATYAMSLERAMLMSSAFGLPFLLAERTSGTWSASVAGEIGLMSWVLMLFLIGGNEPFPLSTSYPVIMGFVLGYALFHSHRKLLAPLLACWNWLIYRIDKRRSAGSRSLLRFHSAFWDDLQRTPLADLENYLLFIRERNPAEGLAAIAYLSRGHQRAVALAAQAHWLERFADVAAIGEAHDHLSLGTAGALEGADGALLRSLNRISQDVQTALEQENSLVRRLMLGDIEERLDKLERELAASNEPYAVQFLPVVGQWRTVLAQQIQLLAEAAGEQQEIDNPYLIGVPLTAQQDIFVGRTDVIVQIERLLRSPDQPPLMLYGQRRMGKTSLLNNLGRLLRKTTLPLFVDMQGSTTRASNYTGFLYNLARSMRQSAKQQRGIDLPRLTRETLEDDPFSRFDEWLDELETMMDSHEIDLALLALDEFEVLDSMLQKERFEESDILGMLRHLIQHRRRLRVLLAGSHAPAEIQHWSGYLINVQVIHIGYLSREESCRLIEQPVPDFALRYTPEAVDRIIGLTRGHPALVQLLCYDVVEHKNRQPLMQRFLATLEDVEAAVPLAMDRGNFFFASVQQNRIDEQGLDLLYAIAAQGEGAVVAYSQLAHQAPNNLAATLELLQRRELIEPEGDGYRFQVELIRRWFAAVGGG